MEYLIFKDERIPLIGFGSYRFTDSDTDALIYGIGKCGMSLIDTAEMYGDGSSEEALGKVVSAVDRKSLFIVDKILPGNAKKGLYLESCMRSLERLKTDYIDLYLLHWRGDTDLADMVYNMESLVSAGLIRHWGVSNFDTCDMEELFMVEGGSDCFCDQILYNLASRGAEYDLIPWLKEHGVMPMAYSPLCNSSKARVKVTSDEIVKEIAGKEMKTPESLMLSFIVRNRDIVTVFKTSSADHVEGNMRNVFEAVPAEDLKALEQRFPAPCSKCPLEKI